ncbi:LuxR C-terminal-related transcriptional regulator [Dechloromonas sp. ZS-1]|uniref:LuxR C-terminal-related transcriptional regulator n=1 Tax=Dechloromonas sp. ZS-1 TaxID=3138067 RepID=UPI0031FD2808
MGITSTGHAEIDHQHEILDTLVAELTRFCPEHAVSPQAVCQTCPQARQNTCRQTLQETVGELGAFLVGHATYEERMMELLPDTPTCQAHIKAHKAAHQGVARQLRKLEGTVRTAMPLEASQEVWVMIRSWLGDHTWLFDNRLVSMTQQAVSPAVNFDNELVAMLDRHVFPNRPTAPRARQGKSAADKARLEIRGRFEQLSPAQRAVFWLVVGGRKNREIAEELGITVNTVKTHRAAIFQKMDVSSVLELIRKTDALR